MIRKLVGGGRLIQRRRVCKNKSPYASNDNNPILFYDPLGNLPDATACCGTVGQIFLGTQEVAGEAILIGGGPEDPFADAAATVIEIGGNIWAGISWLGILKSHPPASVHSPATAPSPTVVNAKSKAKAKDYGVAGGAEHTSNARASTKNKHQEADTRRKQDRQGSKGMKKGPRVRPQGWKGSWPSKSSSQLMFTITQSTETSSSNSTSKGAVTTSVSIPRPPELESSSSPLNQHL